MDLYRIDDVLLRAGGWATLLGLGAALVLAALGWPEAPQSWGDVLLALRPHAAALLLGALCPIALVTAGLVLRRREKRIVGFWFLLQQQAQISVPELLANSDFTRDGLERAVKLINTKGLGYYVWNRSSDVIQDGRLEREYLHVEKCDGCSAELSLRIPATMSEPPRCPYCEDPLSTEHLARLRREALERLRAKNVGTLRESAETGTFSVGLFLLLLFLFWPAAIVYAMAKWPHLRAR